MEEERRIDPADGCAYTKAEYEAEYGGLWEWSQAERIHVAPPAPDYDSDDELFGMSAKTSLRAEQPMSATAITVPPARPDCTARSSLDNAQNASGACEDFRPVAEAGRRIGLIDSPASTALLALLVGPVCAGKTTISAALIDRAHKDPETASAHIWLLEYDRIVLRIAADAKAGLAPRPHPPHPPAEFSSRRDGTEGTDFAEAFPVAPEFEPVHWKEGRALVHRFVAAFLHACHSGTSDPQDSLSDELASIATHFPPPHRPLSDASMQSTMPAKHIIILDDNMYYRSMRMSFYKLAREYGASFCQIFLTAPLEVTLARNELRNRQRPAEERIPEQSLRDIAAAMEPPCPEQRPWEKHTVMLERGHAHMPPANSPAELVATATAWAAVREAWTAPVVAKAVMIEKELAALNEKRAASRRANCSSAAKLVDAATRKQMGVAMKSAPGSERRSLSKTLNAARKALMKNLKARSLPEVESTLYDEDAGAIADAVVVLFGNAIARATAKWADG